MHVTCVAMSLDKLEPERAHGKLSHNMAAVFVNTKTHFGLKQIIVYHVHETTRNGKVVFPQPSSTGWEATYRHGGAGVWKAVA